MIIKLSQTASNIKQAYDIEGDRFYYRGDAGSFSRFQPITLSNKENTVKGVYQFPQWADYIPFRHLFGKANLTRHFCLYKNDTAYGDVMLLRHGFLKSCYVITLCSGETFHCYYLSRGSFDYISIYQGDTQIALVETLLSTSDYKYTHKLYLLEDYTPFADILSFFVVYYASFHFARRMHMSKRTSYVKAWSLSKYSHKYDPQWRETHFPYENFFGKTSLTNDS